MVDHDDVMTWKRFFALLVLCSPRARSLLFMFLRSKGLIILSYVEFCVDFRTELLTNQLLCVRSEIHVM